MTPERTIKLLVLGSKNTGKSALIYRFVTKGPYDGTSICEASTSFQLDEQRINIEIVEWKEGDEFEDDAAFDGAVVAFSSTDRKSFYNAVDIVKYIRDHEPYLPLTLVETKIDDLEHCDTERTEIDNTAEDMQIQLYKTSSEKNVNIINVFAFLVEQILSREERLRQQKEQKEIMEMTASRLSDLKVDAFQRVPENEREKDKKKCVIM